MAFLKNYAGRYILLQESNTVDEKQLEDALSIARKRGVPDNIMEQCQAASAKDTEKGRVVAILELGKTILLNTAQERRKLGGTHFRARKRPEEIQICDRNQARAPHH